MSQAFQGVYAALPTPFLPDETLDEASIEKLVAHAVDQGLDGIYVSGSTGEAFVMSVEERARVLELVAEAGKGQLTLIAHVGAIRTEDCCQLARAANRFGYDAVSAVTPFYYPFGFDALLDHYRAIIQAAEGLPMVVYNFPAMSGVSLSDQQIDQLLGLERVVAIKQTAGDLYQMEKIASRHPDKVVFNGFDEIFLPGQMAGAKGGIGSTYNVMGRRYLAIREAIAAGNVEQAKAIQQSANRVIDTLVQVGVIQGLKYILCQTGVIAHDTVRRPFAPLSKTDRDRLDPLITTELDH